MQCQTCTLYSKLANRTNNWKCRFYTSMHNTVTVPASHSLV